MKRYDFVLGTRFHGAMAAIQSGVPALIITHDSRTQELCEFLNIPFIKDEDFSEEMTVSQLYEMADYSKFNKEYSQKYANILSFLEKKTVRYTE